MRLREDPLPPPQRRKFQLLLLEGRGMKKALLFPFISSTRRKQLQLTALPQLSALAAREILEDHHLASKRRKNKIRKIKKITRESSDMPSRPLSSVTSESQQ